MRGVVPSRYYPLCLRSALSSVRVVVDQLSAVRVRLGKQLLDAALHHVSWHNAGLWAAKLIGLGAGQDPAEHAPPIFAPTLRNDFGVADGPGKMILVRLSRETDRAETCSSCPFTDVRS